jgi:hypothetical protein
MLILKITTDNDAFSGPLRLLHDTGYPDRHVSMRYELARILRSAARIVEFYPDCNYSPLRDVNGNSVGHFEITEDSDKDSNVISHKVVLHNRDSKSKGETQ